METFTSKINFAILEERAKWIWEQTLLVHKKAPGTRIASSLSSIEILICLFYGKILNFNPKVPFWEERDRFIISKAHGSIAMYPLLADLGFFDRKELENVCQEGTFLGSIPDPIIPGYETVNGSLGHGLGVGCGIALALKKQSQNSKVFVLVDDGELCEGSNWEAIMFAAHHRIDNLILVVDHNQTCMLGPCKQVIDYYPLSEKFAAFNWDVHEVDGHNIKELYTILLKYKNIEEDKPKVIIAHTVKGKGVAKLEKSPLSHIISLEPEEIDNLIQGDR